MKPLAGRRILVVGRDYFFYTREIVAELRGALGAEAEFVPIAPEGAWYSALKRLPGAAHAWLQHHHARALARLAGRDFDTVLFIQVHQLAHAQVEAYRRAFAHARFVLYYWDSLATHDYRPWLRHFDAAFSFDPRDVRTDSRLTLLPLFFCDAFRALRARQAFEHDLAFVGTAMSARRYDRVLQFRRWAAAGGVRFFDYLYVSPLFWLRSLLRGQRLRGVHFRSLTRGQLLAIYARSAAIVDLPDNLQSGYTMRTFESLGAHRKLVTTSPAVAGEDFHDPRSVFVLGRDGDFPTKEFLQSAAAPSPAIEKHSLQAWLLVLLGTPAAPGPAPAHRDAEPVTS
jgi:hypothetical protein